MLSGKINVDEEQLYLNALRAAGANGFQESDKFDLDNISSGLKKCGAVKKTFREFVQSEGKANDVEDRSNPSALIYTAIVNNCFKKTFSENALDWHEYFSVMRFVREITDNKYDDKLSRILGKYEDPKHSWRKIGDGYQRLDIRSKILALRKQIPKPKGWSFSLRPKR